MKNLSQTQKMLRPKSNRINRSEALKLVDEYNTHFYGKQDKTKQTMYAWFDLDKLLDFLLEMKFVNKADGLRIYYGAVPANTSSYENRHTIALVGTKKTADPNIFEELVDDNKKGNSKAFIPAFDFASLCPPDNKHVQNETASIAFAVYRAKKNKKKKG